MDLFDYMREQNLEKESPLASRMRPSTLEEVAGQQHIIGKDRLLYRAIVADKLSSVIFYGPPGTGKTTLAKVIANTTSAEFLQLNATSSGKKDMEEVIAKARDNQGMYGKKTILFIDEIHRLNHSVEEILYSAMEDYALDIIVGKGPSARNIRFSLKKFTLIGATTRAGMIANPLRDRFGIMCRLEMYTPEELKDIVKRSARTLGISIEENAAAEVARRSRGTPRIANRLLKRVRDFSTINGNSSVTVSDAKFALGKMEIDDLGLDEVDRGLLRAMIEKFDGGPVGLDTLAAAIGEDAGTIEDVYEPYLIKNGLLNRTPRGRVATELAYRHLDCGIYMQNA